MQYIPGQSRPGGPCTKPDNPPAILAIAQYTSSLTVPAQVTFHGLAPLPACAPGCFMMAASAATIIDWQPSDPSGAEDPDVQVYTFTLKVGVKAVATCLLIRQRYQAGDRFAASVF